MSYLLVLILFAVAGIAPFVREKLGTRIAWLIAGAPAAVGIYFAYQLTTVISTGEPIIQAFTVSEALSFDFSARLDGLSLLFALLVTGIGSLVMLYASSYMHGEEKEGRFYGFLTAFMAAMLGLVLCDNLLLVFVFWELTSITSYLLIGWVHRDASSRTSALQALVTTGLGGLAMLAGLVLLGLAAGTYSFSEIVADPAAIEAVRTSPLLPGILTCILAGCFTKSAQFPFHYWLPNAMAAPTPVSAYLHSSTMVKAGVFLIARLNPIFDGIAGWSTTLTIFGGITMVYAAYMGSRQTILKRLLAYSTVSSLGLMVFLIGLGASNHYALTGAIAYLLAHALFKATMFLVAGSLTHETGVKDIEKLGGLRKAMPWTFAAGFLAALSMAGVPLFLGFQGKEFLLKATLYADHWVLWLWLAAVVGAVWNVMIAFCVGWKPFVGEHIETPQHAHEAPIQMRVGPVLLASLALIAGVLPVLFAKPMVEATVLAVAPPAAASHNSDHAGHADDGHAVAAGGHHDVPHDEPMGPPLPDENTELAHADDHPDEHAGHDEAHADHAIKWGLFSLLIPHDATAAKALGSSLAAVALGIGFFAFRRQWRSVTNPAHNIWSAGPERGYFAGLNSTLRFADWQTRMLQSGHLSRYVLIVILATVGLVSLAVFRGIGLKNLFPTIAAQAAEVGILDGTLVALIVIGALFTAIFRSRLAAVAALGLVGYAVATIFLVYGAPDIAMTQFAIETLTVIIFVLVMYHLPRFLRFSDWRARSLDVVVAGVFGVLMSVLVLLAAGIELAEPISEFFGEWAYKNGPEGEWGGRGKNVINVIIVDFRALDTMGEITVLGIAALGVFTLMKLRNTKDAPRISPQAGPMSTPDPHEETNIGLKREERVTP